MDISQLRGMTEDHPSSEDEATQKKSPVTKGPPPKVPTIARPEGVKDPHDLIRGITEDHFSSDEEGKAKKSPPPMRTRHASSSKPAGPTGDPHRQLNAMTDDIWTSDEEKGKPATSPAPDATKPRGSTSAGKSGGKATRDPHDMIRALTEDVWSSDEESGKPGGKGAARKLSSTGASANLKKPLSDTRPRLSSNSLRPDNTHDLIRGLTEDMWSSDEGKPKTSPRKASTSSSKGAAGGSQQTLVVGSPKKPSISLKPTSPGVKPATLVEGALQSPTSPTGPIRVLFVCFGNICRSPMAHGVLQYLSRPGYLPKGAPQVRVDSAGTGGYHALSPPDARTLELFKIHNIKGFVHKARRVRASDFWDVDYMLCMDAENLRDLRDRRKTLMEKQGGDKEPKARIQLFGEYGGNQTEIVEDPYYGSNEGFDVAWEQVVRMARGFLRERVGVEVDTRDLMGLV